MGVYADLVWRLLQTDQGIQYQVYSDQRTQTEASLVNKLTDQENGLISQRCPDGLGRDSASGHEVSNSSFKSLPSDITHIAAKESKKFEKRRARKRGAIDPIKQDLINDFECSFPTAAPKVQPKTKRGSRKNTKKIICLKVSQSDLKPEECAHNLKSTNAANEDEKHLALLRDYFQLDVDVEKLYQSWSVRDAHFSKVATSFQGIRILRQDPKENLLSFICSSNNHISRIASMIEKLCCHYGDLIAVVDGEKYFSFPSFQSLSGAGVETRLRELGFGYRAKFISSVAKHIAEERADGWLDSLRTLPYSVAKKELLSLMGVGQKVADCVCLMSLDKPGAVPVDTHVWQITLKHYMARLQSAKSLTDKIYNEIGDFYRELWGPYAGWAHAVLFTADLKQNKSDSLPDKEISASKKKNQQ